NATAGRSTAPARPQAQASRSGRQQVAQQQARGRGFTAPYTRGTASASNLRQTAMASCTTRGGRRVCTAAPRNVSFRWSGGMPAPTLEQMTCPDGTMATTALGHTNVVRCVPL
ncbi:MAG: hypothetical protein K2X11_16230, partial [Acetobacteraceae bacterium]|nr:hypothetical protein [Acetobacteraceae bacterium]